MENALYLIPVTLGETEYSKVLPDYNFQVISQIRHFIVENIRSARRFLCKIQGINLDDAEFFELNEHTDIKSVSNYLNPIKNGFPMGIISEAGCPGIADPGALIVEMAHKKNIPVIPLTGPSSIFLSLMASGFNGQSFCFNGYLPAKNNERFSKLKKIEQKIYRENQTQIFIEVPYRNLSMLEAILSALQPQTKLCIASGITTDTEFIKTKTISEWKKSKIPDINKIPTIFLLYK